METPADRLRQARVAAGYETAAAAARAMGVPPPTYSGHENGWGGKITREPFERYAKFFHVNIEWLLTGKGRMRGGLRQIRVHGYVRAGATVEEVQPEIAAAQAEYVELPENSELGALEVDGDSMRPRFMPGEFILFEIESTCPKELIDQYAVVQTLDGRRMIKILREGKQPDRFRLESHWGDAIEEELLGAWRYRGSLPGSALVVPALPASARRRRGSGPSG